MVIYQDECCGCAVPGYPCLGSECSLRHVPHVFCDECGDEIDSDDVDIDADFHYCEECDPDREEEDDE